MATALQLSRTVPQNTANPFAKPGKWFFNNANWSQLTSPRDILPPQFGRLLGAVAEVTGIQFAGLGFATVTLAAIFTIMALLLYRPVSPILPMPAGMTVQEWELQERWQKLQSSATKDSADRTTQVAQLFITGTLLPILTAVLGYIFGKRQDED